MEIDAPEYTPENVSLEEHKFVIKQIHEEIRFLLYLTEGLTKALKRILPEGANDYSK